MHHSFDIDHAVKYGVHEAVLIANFQFWIARNRANGTNEHDGRTWTYNSTRAYADLFPYMTDKQVRRALESLLEHKVLRRGNWNENPYDRTSWFAFENESEVLDGVQQIGQIDLPKKANGSDQEGKSNTDINQIPTLISPKTGWHLPEWIPTEAWKSFEELRRKKKRPMTDRARALAVGKLEDLKFAGQNIQAVIDQTVLHGWDTFYAVKTEKQNGYGKGAHDGKTDQYGIPL